MLPASPGNRASIRIEPAPPALGYVALARPLSLALRGLKTRAM
jgi:hypothetical protein